MRALRCANTPPMADRLAIGGRDLGFGRRGGGVPADVRSVSVPVLRTQSRTMFSWPKRCGQAAVRHAGRVVGRRTACRGC